MSSTQIKEQLFQAKQKYSNLEGITFLGGEPFLQAQGLADIAEYAHTLGLSVMVFTGYLFDELVEGQFSGSKRLLKYIDVLIDGEFDSTQQETIRNWVGSTNQNFYYLSKFYTNEIETRPLSITNEWRVNMLGKIQGNGLP